jgi:DNA-directed RNA polymerase specialized sigma24 family protein
MSCAVHSAAIDRLRRESRRARHEARAAGGRPQASAGDGGLARIEIEERIDWIRRELGKLSSRDRALLRERFEEGKTLREAGRAAGMTGHAAHGRIRRILVRLRGVAREVFGE